MGVQRWARDADWRQALADLAGRPTVNIDGLVGGYTGSGGMTILPHKAVAKIDLRLVPNMTREGAVAKLREPDGTSCEDGTTCTLGNTCRAG
jgi:hypothetical protein